MSAIEIQREDLLSPTAGQLIAALNAELNGRYPEEGATHFRLDPEEVTPGRGAFLVARAGGLPVGCGAFRRLDDSTAELKRMYVVPRMRGHGVGRALIKALEAECQLLGVRRLLLETGIRQPEAVALYERTGFERIPAYGEYVGCPFSICMGKTLTPRPAAV